MFVQWTYSSWKVFKTCAKQYKHLYILKDVKSLRHEANAFGEDAHKQIEDYLNGTIAALPPILQRFEPIVVAVKGWKGQRFVEHAMALGFDMKPCGFWDKNYFVRGKADLIQIHRKKAKVLDWKFGKSAKYADLKQVELMALLIFKHFPEVEEVQAGLMFMVPNKLVQATYLKKDEKAMWMRWLYEISVMEGAKENDNFGPNPNNLCKNYCPVLSCTHNGRMMA